MFVGFTELIADVGRDAWLNSACAQTNEHQSSREHGSLPDGDSPRTGHARESKIAQTVSDRQRQNRPIFADPAVCDDRAKNRKEIDTEHEIVRVHVRLVRTHW